MPGGIVAGCAFAFVSCGSGPAQVAERAYALEGRLDSAEVSCEACDEATRLRYVLASVGGVRRPAILQPSASSIRFSGLQLARRPRARFYLAVDDAAWKGGRGGVTFRMTAGADGEETVVFERTLDPSRIIEDRGWVFGEVDLGRWAGSPIELVLQTDAGPREGASVGPAYWGEPEVVSEAKTTTRLPNVVLVSFDTLRADFLGAYGYVGRTSPNLDRLARRGTVFESCISQSSWTRPAHLSMMAGLHPDRAVLIHDKKDCRIRPEVTTIAETLRANDYLTAAFTGGGYVGTKSGFEQGFDYYRTYGRRFEPNLDPILDWLRAHHRSRFFLFLHNYNVHRPHVPPAELLREFVPRVPRPCRGMAFRDRERGRWAACLEHPEGVGYLKGLYAAEVLHADRLLGEVVETLARVGALDETVIVFTSDHGEGLLDHGYVDHVKSVHQELIHVPLVLAGPGVPAGRRHRGDVQLVDVVPTLLDLLGLPLPGQIDGRSLAPIFAGRGLPPRVAFSASAWSRDMGSYRLIDHDFTAAAVLDGEKILLKRGEGSEAVEKYDLSTDPRESAPAPVETEEDRQLHQALQAWAASLDERSTCISGALDPEKAEQLRALGYLH